MEKQTFDWRNCSTLDELPSYKDIIDSLREKKRVKHLLLGNGFSVEYDYKIFSYNALSHFIENSDDPLLKQLFAAVNTKNFEEIMQQLNMFIDFSKALGADSQFTEKIKSASEKLKENLVEAVQSMHPEHVFKIPEDQSRKCSAFFNDYLNNGGKIFSSNYDLLLYWVLMRNACTNVIDGFGRELENDMGDFIPEGQLEYSELKWGRNKDRQTIFYLHGALLLFDDGIDIVKEEYGGNFLMDKIQARMANKEYPIFVTAGTANDKLCHIMHNKYLNFCYEALTKINGSLITYGFSFGENDSHIIDAINKSAKQSDHSKKLYSIYIGVYSDADLSHIGKIEKQFKTKKVNVYDARTVHAWR